MSSNSAHPKAVILLGIASAAYASAGIAAVSTIRNAVWAEHDVTIELQHLQKAYSCEDLTYKIHDVLQTVGARANMRILVNRCANGIDTRIVAPRAHLVFSLPLEVRGHLAGSADLFARERTVRIEPGNPPSIDASDCELLRQLEITLFRAMPLPIEATHLACQRVTTQHTPFSFSIEALMPDANGPAKVSRVSGPMDRLSEQNMSVQLKREIVRTASQTFATRDSRDSAQHQCSSSAVAADPPATPADTLLSDSETHRRPCVS